MFESGSEKKSLCRGSEVAIYVEALRVVFESCYLCGDILTGSESCVRESAPQANLQRASSSRV